MRDYNTDYAGWAEDTAAAILDCRWSDVDRVALADEVADLARKERRAIRHRLEVLFVHLLKLEFQPEKKTRSWELTIKEQRLRLLELLDENPSLKAPLEMAQSVQASYKIARVRAARETELPEEAFPEQVPFTFEQIWGE